MGRKISKILKVKKILNIAKPSKVEEQVEEESEYEDPKALEKYMVTHSLRPPYSVIVDTNFINDAIRKKFDLKEVIMKAVNANVKMCVPECVFGEMERLGRVYRVGLAMLKSYDIERLKCDHEGTYADDCIVNRITAHNCYIVATSDSGLKQRIRKVPGVPIICFRGRRCFAERFIPATFK